MRIRSALIAPVAATPGTAAAATEQAVPSRTAHGELRPACRVAAVPVPGSSQPRSVVPGRRALEVPLGGRHGGPACDRTFPAGEAVAVRTGYRLNAPGGKTVPGV